jgi:hypothetical protein
MKYDVTIQIYRSVLAKYKTFVHVFCTLSQENAFLTSELPKKIRLQSRYYLISFALSGFCQLPVLQR